MVEKEGQQTSPHSKSIKRSQPYVQSTVNNLIRKNLLELSTGGMPKQQLTEPTLQQNLLVVSVNA